MRNVTDTSAATLHQLPTSLDLAAMAVAAAFAAHVGRKRQVPLFGVLLAGLVGGLGGGMLRDVLLGLEPVAITTWYYVPVVLAAAIAGGLTARRIHFSHLPFVAAQAVAVGLLIGIGVQKAVEYHTPAPAAILLGVVTGTFGGAVDDVLTGRRAVVMADDHWLLGIVIFGAVVFWGLTIYVAFAAAVVVTVVVVTALRVLSVHFGWTSPAFPGDDVASPL
jgi:uncharacterized membrane protein YeiH